MRYLPISGVEPAFCGLVNAYHHIRGDASIPVDAGIAFTRKPSAGYPGRPNFRHHRNDGRGRFIEKASVAKQRRHSSAANGRQ